MTSQYQTQQRIESLRVRFYRAYIGDLVSHQSTPAPIGNWLQEAEVLPFDDQPSRYHEVGNGRRVYTVVDRTHSPILFQINRTMYQGVPPAELLGDIGTNYLVQGQGLMNTWYATAFDHVSLSNQSTVLAIATKGNIAPNVMLRDYIQDKFPSDAAQLRIEQLAHRDILNRIANMREGTLFEISIKPAFIETIRAVDRNLADAFHASQTVYEQNELSQVIKPIRTGRFGLRERFQDVVALVLGSEQHRDFVTKLRMGGLFGTSNRTTIINLLSNELSLEIEVPYTDPIVDVLDGDAVYTAIQDAYQDMSDAISEATEISAWQRRENWYKRHFIGADASAAATVAIIITLIIWLPGMEETVVQYSQDTRQALYRTIATIAGSLTGFTITVTTLILGNWGHQSLALIAQHPNRSKEIRTVLKHSTWSMATTMVASLVAIAIDINDTPNRIIMSATIIATIFSIVRLFEAIWLVQSIAAIITTSRNNA